MKTFILILCVLINNILFASEKKIDWSLELAFGITLDKGNTDRIGSNFLFDMRRISDIDEFVLNANASYGESEGRKDKNKGELTLKYDYDFFKKESFFIFIMPSYNEFQNLKLRMQNGIGLKHTFYKTKFSDYSLSGAVIYELKQYFDIPQKDEITRLSFRPKIKYFFNDKSHLYFVLFYQPKIDNCQDYRILSKFILEFNIYKKLFFEFRIIDEYNNIVPEGIERNDITIVNSIKLKL